MQWAKCALIAAVALGGTDKAVEVTDTGSLRTHGHEDMYHAGVPSSLVQLSKTLHAMHSDFNDKMTALNTVETRLDDVNEILTAEHNQVAAATNNADVQEATEGSESTQNMNNIATFNNAVSKTNNLNSNEVSDQKSVNSELAGINTLTESFHAKQERLAGFQHTLETKLQKFTNARELYQIQTDSLAEGVEEIGKWGQHATPLINTQIDALLKVEAWMTHLDGELKSASDMAEALAKSLEINIGDVAKACTDEDLQSAGEAEGTNPTQAEVDPGAPLQEMHQAGSGWGSGKPFTNEQQLTR